MLNVMTRTNDGRTDVRMNDGTQLASYLFLLPVMIYDGVCVGLRKLRAICSSLEQLLSAHHETKKNQLIRTQIQRHGEKSEWIWRNPRRQTKKGFYVDNKLPFLCRVHARKRYMFGMAPSRISLHLYLPFPITSISLAFFDYSLLR